MNTATSEDLLVIRLPLEDDSTATEVLVQVRSVSAGGETSVIMNDSSEHGRIVRSIIGPAGLPQAYQSRNLGPASEFLTSHEALVEQLVVVGAAQQNKLTIARAVLVMHLQKLDASAALRAALQIDRAVARMQDRHSLLAKAAVS